MYLYCTGLEDVGCQEDCAPYLAVLTVHIDMMFWTCHDKSFDLFDGLHQLIKRNIRVILITEMVYLS